MLKAIEVVLFEKALVSHLILGIKGDVITIILAQLDLNLLGVKFCKKSVKR